MWGSACGGWPRLEWGCPGADTMAPMNEHLPARPPVTLRAARAKVGAVPGVPSPCISVCEMDEATSSCKGCFRTLAEISQWSRMADAEKIAVWQQIEARQTSLATGL